MQVQHVKLHLLNAQAAVALPQHDAGIRAEITAGVVVVIGGFKLLFQRGPGGRTNNAVRRQAEGVLERDDALRVCAPKIPSGTILGIVG